MGYNPKLISIGNLNYKKQWSICLDSYMPQITAIINKYKDYSSKKGIWVVKAISASEREAELSVCLVECNDGNNITEVYLQSSDTVKVQFDEPVGFSSGQYYELIL